MESREESNATDPRRFSTSPSDPLELTASSIDPRESCFDPKTPEKLASVSALKSPPSAFSTTFANSSLYKPPNPGSSAGGHPLNRSVSFRESADGASAPGLMASSTNSSISLPTAAVATSSAAPSHHHSVSDHHQDHNGGAPNTPSASRRSLRSGGGGGSSAASSSQASSTYVLGTKRLHRRTVPKADADAAPTHINNLPTAAATPQQTPKLRPLTGTSTVGTRSVASSAAATSRRAGGSAVANARRRYPSSGQNGTTEHPKTAEAVALSLLLILFGALVCILCFLYVAAPSTPSNLMASRSLVGEEPRVEAVVNQGGAAHSQQDAVDPSTIRKLRWSVLCIIVAMAALLSFAVKRRLAPKAPTLSASALEQHTKAQREKEGQVSQSPLLDDESDLMVTSPSSAVNISSRPLERAPGSSNSQQEKLPCPIHRRLGCPCGWAAAVSVSGRNGPASQRCGGPTTGSSGPPAPTPPLRKVSLCGALKSPNHHGNNGSSPPVNKGSAEGFHKSPDQVPSTATKDDDVSASSPQRQLELLA